MGKQINVVMSSMPPYEEFIEEIKDLWDTRQLTHQGAKYCLLEQRLKEKLGVDNISMFANGHLALELAIKALNLTGEVITTPFTFASTTQAIVNCNLRPVFCDINKKDYTIDVNKIEKLITNKTSAIIPVHVYGNVCDVYAIERIANKHNLKVIYDAAHVFGVKVDNIPIGRFGDMSMFSFHATKVYHTVEGGALTFSDNRYVKILSELRQFGMDGQESVPIVGTNAKMTEMHAAMGLCNLRHIDEEISKRRRVFEHYLDRIGNIRGIKLCKHQGNIKANYAYFPVLFEDYKYNRNEIFEKLKANRIFARKYFYPLTSDFEAYKGLFEIHDTPVAREISSSILTLPLYADLSIEEVDRICDIVLN